MMPGSVVGGEGQERDVARALDGQLDTALMLDAEPGDATRHDLAALGHEVAQALRVLVVHRHRVVRAVGATTAARTAPTIGQTLVVAAHVAIGGSASVSSLLSHCASSELSARGFSKSSSSAGSSSRELRSGPPSKPSLRSIVSSTSSSPGSSTASNLSASASTVTLLASMSACTCTVWYLSTSSSMRRLRSTSATAAPPPTYLTYTYTPRFAFFTASA